jgi:hypothetical protein
MRADCSRVSATAPPSAHACIQVCICRHVSSLHHEVEWQRGRLAFANDETGGSRACSSSENNRLCQQFQAPQCSTTAEQQTVFAATEDLVCSVIDCVNTHMEGYQLAREFGLPSSNGHRPTLPSIPGILHIGVSRVRVTMSSTLTTRHRLSDMTCCLPNRFAMRSRGFCAIYRAFKSPVRSLVTRLGLIRRLEVHLVRKCERL